VLLEQDYLKGSSTYNFTDPRLKALNEYSSELIRQLIIPKLTKEVNTSKRYAPLRQAYYSLVLARWFKSRFSGKPGLYPGLIDKKELSGLTSQQAWSKTTYFQQYQRSFKEGEYNIKEQAYTPYGQTIRSYFSGGVAFDAKMVPEVNSAASPVRTGSVFGAIANFSEAIAAASPAMVKLTGVAGKENSLGIMQATEQPITASATSAASPAEGEQAPSVSHSGLGVYVSPTTVRDTKDSGPGFKKEARTIYIAKDIDKHSDLVRRSLGQPVDNVTATRCVIGHEAFHFFVDAFLSSKGMNPRTNGIDTDLQEEELAIVFEYAVALGLDRLNTWQREKIERSSKILGISLDPLIQQLHQAQENKQFEEILQAATGLDVNIDNTLTRKEIYFRGMGRQLMEDAYLDSRRYTSGSSPAREKPVEGSVEQKAVAIEQPSIAEQQLLRLSPGEQKEFLLYVSKGIINPYRNYVQTNWSPEFDWATMDAHMEEYSDIKKALERARNTAVRYLTIQDITNFDMLYAYLETKKDIIPGYRFPTFINIINEVRQKKRDLTYITRGGKDTPLTGLRDKVEELMKEETSVSSPAGDVREVTLKIAEQIHNIYQLWVQAKHQGDFRQMRTECVALSSYLGKFLANINKESREMQQLINGLTWGGMKYAQQDLRNPLALISNFLSLMIENMGDYNEALAAVEGLVDRIVRVEHQLENIQRWEVGRIGNKELVDLERSSTSSPAKTPEDRPGGIDFRAMNIVTQPMGSFTGLNFTLPIVAGADKINLDQELQQLRRMLKGNILPSGQRLKELLAVCVQKRQMNKRISEILACLADICKLQEEMVCESSPELREALVIVDSGKFAAVQ